MLFCIIHVSTWKYQQFKTTYREIIFYNFLRTYYYSLNIQYWMPFWNLKNAYFLYINKCGGASFVWGLTWYAHFFVINITVNRSWDNFNKCKYSKLYVSFVSSKSIVESSKAFMIYVIVVLIAKVWFRFMLSKNI